MPLKKPKSNLKIVKARTKNPLAVIQSTPEKKKGKVDYICSAYYYYDNAQKKTFSVFRLETSVFFSSFIYEISAEKLEREGKNYIVLYGISAKSNSAPVPSPAYVDFIFDIPQSDYEINIVKQDGCINSAVFQFDFENRNIELLSKSIPKKKNNRLFCDFKVDTDKFSFSPESK